jgi:hypothetical protein
MPKSAARARCFGESPPSVLAIVRCDTTAWIIPERAKPKMRGQRISQNMLKAIKRASRILRRMVIVVSLPKWVYLSGVSGSKGSV